MTPQNVATAQRNLSEAQAAHVAAADKVAAIHTRIADAKLLQSRISANRVNGKSSPAEAAEFAALGGDVGLLEKMLAEAQTTAASLLSAQHIAADHLRTVQGQFDTAQAQIAFDALTGKAQLLEDTLISCVKELHTQGRNLGRGPSLTMSWRPSRTLSAYCNGSTL